MITLLKKNDYKIGLWKNGKGKTSQIAIFPEDESFLDNLYLWRLSSAEISQSDHFSEFKNYQRFLVLYKGEGVILNSNLLPLHTPYFFSGHDSIFCELNNNIPAMDLGVIYNPDKIKVRFNILTIDPAISLFLESGTHFLFNFGETSILIKNNYLESGDSLQITNSNARPLEIKINAIFTCYHIQINYRS